MEETVVPPRQMRLVTHLKDEGVKEEKKCKLAHRHEWRSWDGEGRRREAGKEGVVASCNGSNLNLELTRCGDCRVLKI